MKHLVFAWQFLVKVYNKDRPLSRWLGILVLTVVFYNMRHWDYSNPSETLAAGRKFHGRGMWIWKWHKAEGGNVQNVIRRCKVNKVNFLLIKVNDGREVIDPSGESVPIDDVQKASCQLTKGIVDQLHEDGIAIHGWSMIYGGDIQKEIDFGVWALHDLGTDGFCFDTEGHIKNKAKAAEAICGGIRNHIDVCNECRGKKLAYSPFRNPEKHRSLPYEVFSRYCHVMMPQVYWWYPHSKRDPKEVFLESYGQWLNLERDLHPGDEKCNHQIVPVSQTMYGAPPEQILEFAEVAKGYHGLLYWKWEDTSQVQWEAIRNGPLHTCDAQCQ